MEWKSSNRKIKSAVKLQKMCSWNVFDDSREIFSHAIECERIQIDRMWTSSERFHIKSRQIVCKKRKKNAMQLNSFDKHSRHCRRHIDSHSTFSLFRSP